MLLNIGAQRFFVQSLGPADAPPVLFVHGFPLSHEMWLEAARAISSTHHCLLPDLRGLGRSGLGLSSAPPEPASMARYSDDLIDLLDTCHIRRPVTVVGLSMGGMIALDLVARHRSRLGGLVLCCTRSGADSEEAKVRRRALIDAVRTRGARAAAEDMLPRVFGPDAPTELRDRWMEIMAATPAAGVIAAAEALMNRPDRTADLAAIDLPTLVVAGDSDFLTPAADLMALAAQVGTAQPGRRARFACLHTAGHLAPLEQPGQFAAVLQSFLREVAGEHR